MENKTIKFISVYKVTLRNRINVSRGEGQQDKLYNIYKLICYSHLIPIILTSQLYNIFWRLNPLFSLVTQSCPTLCGPMDCSTPGLPVHHQLPELTQTHVHQIGDAIQPSHLLCRPLLLLPSIFLSIRVFSNESVLCIRWPKYWSFSFSISPSNEYSGLIAFRIDWFDLLAVQATLKSLL